MKRHQAFRRGIDKKIKNSKNQINTTPFQLSRSWEGVFIFIKTPLIKQKIIKKWIVFNNMLDNCGKIINFAT